MSGSAHRIPGDAGAMSGLSCHSVLRVPPQETGRQRFCVAGLRLSETARKADPGRCKLVERVPESPVQVPRPPRPVWDLPWPKLVGCTATAGEQHDEQQNDNLLFAFFSGGAPSGDRPRASHELKPRLQRGYDSRKCRYPPSPTSNLFPASSRTATFGPASRCATMRPIRVIGTPVSRATS